MSEIIGVGEDRKKREIERKSKNFLFPLNSFPSILSIELDSSKAALELTNENIMAELCSMRKQLEADAKAFRREMERQHILNRLKQASIFMNKRDCTVKNLKREREREREGEKERRREGENERE